MKYNGKELVEMIPENWDGKSRSMLVWNDNSLSPYKKIVVGHFLRGDYWMAEDGNCWQYCAEIPEESYITNNMTEDKIIEKFKTLRTELFQWLKNNDVSSLLVNNLQYGIKTALNLTHANHHFIDVVDFSKIDTNAKKTRRMTHRELANWLSNGNGEWTNAGNRTAYQRFDYDIEREDEAISEHIKIRSWNETEWREPLIEE